MLTTAEAAAELEVVASRVRQYRLDGEFPGAVQRGRDWFIPKTEVVALKKRRKPRGRPAGQVRPADGTRVPEAKA